MVASRGDGESRRSGNEVEGPVGMGRAGVAGVGRSKACESW